MAEAKKSAKTAKKDDGFSADERAAMKDRAKELKAAKAGADSEKLTLAAIAEMQGTDRELAERIHAIIKTHAPGLKSKTWYGMPAYANKADKVVVFFQAADKFKARYATLGFNDAATLDDGNMWPVAFGLTKITAADEKRIAELIKKAAG
jgi:uncharacterized protein YdhG (YjbR/CyaY superfamily)